MKKLTIERPRKDGKFPVKTWYQGASNMFGGFDYPRTYSKLKTLEKLREMGFQLYTGDEFTNNSGLTLDELNITDKREVLNND